MAQNDALRKEIHELSLAVQKLNTNVEVQNGLIEKNKEIQDLLVQQLRFEMKTVEDVAIANTTKIVGIDKRISNLEGSIATAKWLIGAAWTAGSAVVMGLIYIWSIIK